MDKIEVKKAYKIRHKITGLYSGGGEGPSWNKKGKIWNTYAHVMAHLAQFFEIEYRQKKSWLSIPDEWEIVELQITISEKDPVSAREAYRSSKGFKERISYVCGNCIDYDNERRHKGK